MSSDYRAMQIHVEQHLHAALSSLEELLNIAGRDEQGYRIVQQYIDNLREVSAHANALVEQLKRHHAHLWVVS